MRETAQLFWQRYFNKNDCPKAPEKAIITIMHNKVIQRLIRPLQIFLVGSALVWLIFTTCRSQLEYTWRPLINALPHMMPLLALPDIDKLQALAPSYHQVIQAINTYPPNTRFYFIPSFKDSGNSGFWWWYLYLLCRYYAYPRQILSHNEFFYKGEKSVYLDRCINGAKSFTDISWFKQRGIDQVILIRHNKVEILPPDTSTDTL